MGKPDEAGQAVFVPSTKPTLNSCCGSPLQVIPLRAGPDGPVVELLRCRRCTRSHWRSEGTDVSRSQALDALGPTATPPPTITAPQPARAVRAPRAAPTAPARAAELRNLLAGWQVLGS
jgi:hypothetical protein